MESSYLDGTVLRIVEGVTIGVVVAAILIGKDWWADQRHRQEEIAHISDLIVSARSDISEAQPTNVAEYSSGRLTPRHYSKEDVQRWRWDKLIARLSDVLAHRTSRLSYDEKRELRLRFPGIAVDGRSLLGDGLDVIVKNRIPISYEDMFTQAEEVEWLGLRRDK